MFSAVVLDHFQSPRNVGEMPNADVMVFEENPVCGDRLQVWLRVVDNIVVGFTWRGEGCAPAIAAASMVSEMIVGMSLQEAACMSADRVTAALGGLPPRKSHASQLAVNAVLHAVDEYRS